MENFLKVDRSKNIDHHDEVGDRYVDVDRCVEGLFEKGKIKEWMEDMFFSP